MTGGVQPPPFFTHLNQVMNQQQPITGYRVFFPDRPPEDFPNLDTAWARRCEHFEKTGEAPYVHTLRLGGPEVPVLD